MTLPVVLCSSQRRRQAQALQRLPSRGSLGALLLHVRSSPVSAVVSESESFSALSRWRFCVSECQKADRKLGYHKRTCGKRLSDVDPVPLYSASDLASSSSTVNRHLRRQLDALARNSDALWHTFNGHETISTMFGCGDGSGTPEGAEELKAHHLANRKLAVEQKDPLAIGIIALAATEGFKSTDLDLKWHRTEAEIAKSRREAARLLAVTKEQLRREFELTEDELEDTMVLALRNMPEWGQEAHKATVDRV